MRGSQASARRRNFVWLDALAAICAAGGVTFSALYNVQFRASDFAASDFKTLYASIWCFVHGMNAYSIPNIQTVFIANGIVQPPRWFGHAPVYPWTTLALGSPAALLGMETACYAIGIVSGLLLAMAFFALMRYAATRFSLGPAWRVVIAGLCAASPLVAFGLDMGNVSVIACALCFLAFLLRGAGSLRGKHRMLWALGMGLAVAFLLKPHEAFWVGLGMALLPERAGRAIALRALALVAAFTGLTAAALAMTGTLGMQTHAYLAMLASETSGNSSMSASSREVLPAVSQITSVDSIIGFWTSSPAVRLGLTCIVLLVLALLLLRLTRRVGSERGALLAVSAWCAFGTLATYHRSQDAMLLLLLTPWIVDRVRRAPREWHAWVVAALYCGMSLSAHPGVVQRWVNALPAHSLLAFVLLRQSGLTNLLLLAVVELALAHENAGSRAKQTETVETEALPTPAAA